MRQHGRKKLTAMEAVKSPVNLRLVPKTYFSFAILVDKIWHLEFLYYPRTGSEVFELINGKFQPRVNGWVNGFAEEDGFSHSVILARLY